MVVNSHAEFKVYLALSRAQASGHRLPWHAHPRDRSLLLHASSGAKPRALQTAPKITKIAAAAMVKDRPTVTLNSAPRLS